MPRGLSQERAQRIWDAAFAAFYVEQRQHRALVQDENSPTFRTLVAEEAADLASEAVEGLRERQRRERSKR